MLQANEFLVLLHAALSQAQRSVCWRSRYRRLAHGEENLADHRKNAAECKLLYIFTDEMFSLDALHRSEPASGENWAHSCWFNNVEHQPIWLEREAYKDSGQKESVIMRTSADDPNKRTPSTLLSAMLDSTHDEYIARAGENEVDWWSVCFLFLSLYPFESDIQRRMGAEVRSCNLDL